jgi:hypothetical protein
MLLLCFGGSLDNWAHFHGKVDESFFTPWHAVIYGMMAMFGLFLGASATINTRKGFAWQRSLPPGYMLSLLGVGLFIIAGVTDLCWHVIFGIEYDVAAYVSPTHLFLLGSALLAGTGPLRSAWLTLQPSTARGWLTLGPVVLSAASAVAALAMFTQFASPMLDTFAAKNTAAIDGVSLETAAPQGHTDNMNNVRDRQGMEQAFGIAEIIVQVVLLMSMALVLARTWTLPFGAVGLLIALPSTVQALMVDNYWLIVAVFGTGLIADVLLTRMNSPLRGNQLYAIASIVPAIYVTFMFVTLWLTVGIGWPQTLIAGSVVYAAASGLFCAFLLEWPIHYAARARRRSATTSFNRQTYGDDDETHGNEPRDAAAVVRCCGALTDVPYYDALPSNTQFGHDRAVRVNNL